LHRAVNDFNKAEAAYKESLDVLKDIGGATASSQAVLAAYRETAFRIAELFHALKKYDEAAGYYEESLRMDDIMGHDDPAGEQCVRALLKRVKDSQ
jgi:tetratricopeptide (TPR) repeat protein